MNHRYHMRDQIRDRVRTIMEDSTSTPPVGAALLHFVLLVAASMTVLELTLGA
ncbi:MAG: hypothetical protein H6982_14125 [Chromatiales bacterium]|nr:hypothetical protein [Chromatiales bacterium]